MLTRPLLCSAAIAAALAIAAPTGAGQLRELKKGDKITVRGCLSGSALDSTDVKGPENTQPVLEPLTFRLTGDKNLLKDLRQKHNNRVVEVTGELKSDLSPGFQTRTVGRVRIGIGQPDAAPGRPQAESRRAVPVLELKSFEGGSTSCER